MRLIRFGLQNFLSFRDRTELSFVATALNDEASFTIGSETAKRGLLPAVGVFGANASGKSNLLIAIGRFRTHVSESFGWKSDSTIGWTPWRLLRSTGAPPTLLYCDFELDGIHHQYGFSFDDARYHTEWLHRWPKRQKQIVFERNHDEAEPFYFGPSFRGDRTAIAEATRKNALFLSTSAQFNHQELSAVKSALVTGLRVKSPLESSGIAMFSPDSAILRPENRQRLIGLLHAADLGAHDFEAKKPAGLESVANELANELANAPEDMRLFLDALHQRTQRVAIQLQRRGSDGRSWAVPPNFESAGTQVLLSRFNDLGGLESGLHVVDEFDASLHPDLCWMLLRMFTDGDQNIHGAQLLFASHDRGLLQHLRRDQVVLVEKDVDGASRIRCASDFDGVRGRHDLRRLHEQGRLGGVPTLGIAPRPAS